MSTHSVPRTGACRAVLFLASILAASAAHAAATLNVTTTAMTIAADGNCSLPEAMQAARTNATVNECSAAGGPPFTINLQAGQTYNATTIGSTDAQFGNSAMQAANNAIEIVGNGATITQTGQPMRLFLHNSGTFTLRNLTLTGGNAVATGTPFGEWGGAVLSVFPGAVLNLEDVTVRNNVVGLEGAAFYVTALAVANLNRVAVYNNAAAGGTGTAFQARIDQAALFNVANSTFDGPARAIAATAVSTAVNVSSSTFRSSSGIATDLYTGATMTIQNSIVLGSCAPSGGTYTLVNNAASSVDCSPAFGIPVLSTLAAHGGPTNTLVPRLPHASKDAAPGCTYLSAGANPLFANGAAITTDQRGFARDANCDLGAVESMTIAPAALALPGGTFGTPYSATITQTGGAAPVTFTVTAGSPPPGLSLNAGTGEISGTPTAAGTVAFTVTVTDANGITTDMRYTLAIARANQTITFDPQASPRPFATAAFALSPVATASSGLAITYVSLTTGVCTVAGTNVTPVTAGVCTIRASQAGDVNYFAATSVTQDITIDPTVPGAPTIGTATAGAGSATVTFTAPANNGGQAITLYTATCGAFSATSATVAPIVVSGLTNGTPYSCTVTATNPTGTSVPSAPSNSVIPVSTAITGATPAGPASATLSGGGAGCTFAPMGNGPLQSAGFIPLSGHPKSPPAPPPPNVTFPFALLDFVLIGCTPGSTVTLTVTYPANAGGQYWKYGPTPANPTPSWYTIPATFSGNTATFSITDGGLGDDDLLPNGTIVDQGGPGVTQTPVPTLSMGMLAALAALMAAGVALRRRTA